MKKTFFISALLFMGFCTAQNFPSISAEEAYKKMNTEDSLVFVDVRTVEEFEGPLGHIEGAVLIPLHTLEKDADKLNLYKDREIIVYCRSGNRSQDGTIILRNKGFNAKNMLGGIRAWNSLPKQD